MSYGHITFKMGKKKDLSSEEKASIVKYLSRGRSTLEISRTLGRDHRTIKAFASNGEKNRKKRVEPMRRKLTARDLSALKREMSKQPLCSSSKIFSAVGLGHTPKTTRNRVLKSIGKVKKAQRRPPLNQRNKDRRLAWCKKYMKLDFGTVIWTDEMRATLDGPDGWARGWIAEGFDVPSRFRRQQGGGGVMIWAGIIKNELIGPFRVAEGVKMNSVNYCQFLEEHLLKWLKKKTAAQRKKMMFMHDNAPSHASKFTSAWLASKGFKEDTIMEWPPSSPDLNCIENLWSILKRRVYENGVQFSSQHKLWEAIVKTAKSINPVEIENFHGSFFCDI